MARRKFGLGTYQLGMYQPAGGWLLAAVLTAAMATPALAQTAPVSPPATPSVAPAVAPSAVPATPPPGGVAASPGVVAPSATAVVAPQAPQPAAAPTVALPTVAPTTVAPPAALTLPPQPPPPGKRGFLNDFGNWWDQSIAKFSANWKEQQAKMDEFNKQSAAATQEAMKNAADAMRPSHVVEIQQVCPTAGNGAPDCATAAADICKGKGYKAGQPLDVRTAEKCNASLWMSGQPPTTAANCPVETVLLRVACQ